MGAAAGNGFELLSLQASVLTPGARPPLTRAMQELAPAWRRLFDAEPAVFPHAEGLPRLSLRSTSGLWRCDLEPGRVDVHWMRADVSAPAIEPAAFHAEAVAVLQRYAAFAGVRVGRLAAVVSWFAQPDAPAARLQAHLCRQTWQERWGDDAEGFELHVHRRRRLGRFEINYRIRNRAGAAFGTGSPPLLNVEQDANTLAEDAATQAFDAGAIAEFFGLAEAEHDATLRRLYPAGPP